MEENAIRKLDVNSLLTRKVTKETVEETIVNPTSTPNMDTAPCIGGRRGSEIIEAEVTNIDDLTGNFGNPHLPSSLKTGDVQEQTINEILSKYNKKYDLDLHYGTLQDSLNLAVEGDKLKSSLMNGIVANSILSLVDYTNFLLIITCCKQIQGLVGDLLEGDNLGTDDKVVLLDRCFLWITRLQGLKSMYTPTDIEHIIKRMESNKIRTGGTNANAAITKILEILKLGKKED